MKCPFFPLLLYIISISTKSSHHGRSPFYEIFKWGTVVWANVAEGPKLLVKTCTTSNFIHFRQEHLQIPIPGSLYHLSSVVYVYADIMEKFFLWSNYIYNCKWTNDVFYDRVHLFCLRKDWLNLLVSQLFGGIGSSAHTHFWVLVCGAQACACPLLKLLLMKLILHRCYERHLKAVMP